jgi:peroxiredoxin
VELREHYQEIQAFDAEVLAVSTDDLQGADYAVMYFGAPFPILYDPSTQVPRSYNVYNLHGDGLASASVFLIDKKGNLRFKEIGAVYSHQVPASKIINELRKLEN